MEIGERIRLRRNELGLTQTELAQRMGLTSKTTICKAETKDFNPTMDRIKEFAKALETTPSYLMGWSDSHSYLAESDMMQEKFFVDIEDGKKAINIIPEISIETEKKALELFQLYEKADPNIKAAIEALLRGQQ